MRQVPYFDLKRQYESIKPEIDLAIQRVLSSGNFVSGAEVEAFENEFAEYCNRKYCVAVNSGTSALHLALYSKAVVPHDWVVTVPNTFVATVEAIKYCGAIPKFVDVNPVTGNMDMGFLSDFLWNHADNVGAIVPVDLWGNPCEMAGALNHSRQYNIPVVEDACQAHGAWYNSMRVGSLGEVSCFSFFPSKNLGCYGEGGAIVTDDKEVVNIAKTCRDHGQWKKNCHDVLGYNYRMSELQASILRVKLPYLDNWVESRRDKAYLYCYVLGESYLSGSSYYVYTIRVKNRDKVQKYLKDKGIGTAIHYPTPIHLQPAYAHLGYKKGDFPVAEQLCNETLSLPLYPELPDEDIEYVCKTLKEVL